MNETIDVNDTVRRISGSWLLQVVALWGDYAMVIETSRLQPPFVVLRSELVKYTGDWKAHQRYTKSDLNFVCVQVHKDGSATVAYAIDNKPYVGVRTAGELVNYKPVEG